MIRKYLYYFVFFMLVFPTKGFCTRTSGLDSLIVVLRKEIEKTAIYDAAKLKKIEKLRKSLVQNPHLEKQYELNLAIYKEFELFQFDSAIHYASKARDLGIQLKDKGKVSESNLKIAFAMLSAGMFLETSNILDGIRPDELPNLLKGEYYWVQGRLYLDLAAFYKSNLATSIYKPKLLKALQKASEYYPEYSFEKSFMSGLYFLQTDNWSKAESLLKPLLNKPSLTLHQRALVTSSLSWFKELEGQNKAAIILIIDAAIADIRSSTKEEVALNRLANIFYEEGDLNNAVLFAQKAQENAQFYGAKQRETSIGPLIQLIQNSKINAVEQQRYNLIRWIAAMCLFLLLLIILSAIIYHQVKKLKSIQASLEKANNKLQEINEENKMYIEHLRKNNEALREAESIKEGYISYFVNLGSELFQKVERLKNIMSKKANENKMDEIKYLLNKFSLRGEKDDVLGSFDQIFLQLFPDFVVIFNSLFKPEDQIVLKEKELLNTELRIFALIRMGITNNERIAQILEYSVNTIYTYKTKIKNKALVPNDEFEETLKLLVRVAND